MTKKKMGRPKLPVDRTRVNITITLPPELALLAANTAGSKDKDNRAAVRTGIMEILQDELVRERVLTANPAQPIIQA